MAKTKTEKIADIQAQIEQLKNQEKRLMQQQKEQERKDRTKRLCKRMGLLESMLPDTIPLTEEQFKIFLERTIITEHSRHILTEIQAGHINPILSNTAGTAQSNGAEREQDGDNGARVTG
ncbi:MAG TPA: hypothetical protein DEP23_14955 [Ruminococcaceae bacterium]|nr:hypothetical protein [Oscillospiraceae bacterium]